MAYSLLPDAASGPRPGATCGAVDGKRRRVARLCSLRAATSRSAEAARTDRDGGRGYLEPWPLGPRFDSPVATFRAGNAPRPSCPSAPPVFHLSPFPPSAPIRPRPPTRLSRLSQPIPPFPPLPPESVIPPYHDRFVPHPERFPRSTVSCERRRSRRPQKEESADAPARGKKRAGSSGRIASAWRSGSRLMVINRLCRPRAADLHEVPDGRRHRPGALGPAADAGVCGRRRDHRRRAHARSRTRRSSASPRSAPSPTCARTSRRTSCACRSATSTRPRPAS